MVKSSVVYTCSNCEAQYPKWIGRCSECGKFGTVSTTGQIINRPAKTATMPIAAPINLASAELNYERYHTTIKEFDRVTNGLAAGAVVLLAGEPGLGKSTLVLQIADKITKPVLYISGEEAVEQVAGRVKRLGLSAENLSFLNATDVETVVGTAVNSKPALLIIDSLQTLTSSDISSPPGSPGQIKAVTAKLVEAAKANKITTLLIGHVTKGGEVAGPKTLEHLVDVVLNLEGEPDGALRLLRCYKNRFGPSDEVGFFQMTSEGVKEVANPSALLLASRHHDAGSCISVVQEGSRSLFIEVQALVARTRFGYPKRTAAGFDAGRLQLLLAVLQEKGGIRLSFSDVYVNLAGGIKSREPGLDLAVALAILSAYLKKPLPEDVLVAGEVGLAGEIRQVKNLSRKLKEARSLGLTRVVTAGVDKTEKLPVGLEIISLKNLAEVVGWLNNQF